MSQILLQPEVLTLTYEGETIVLEVAAVGLQGPPGIPGSGGGTAIQEAEADESIAPGQPVYLKPNGHAGLARANTIATARVIGLATAAAVSGSSLSYAVSGVVELVDWTAIVGGTVLSPGVFYFLSAQAGQLTITAPTSPSEIVTIVAQALTPRKLALKVHPYIRL
jgi:hypothetical protein